MTKMVEYPKNAYKHAALAYVNQWYKLDEAHQVALMPENLAKVGLAESGKAFKRLAIAYSVVRGFGSFSLDEVGRAQGMARKYEALAERVHATPTLTDANRVSEIWKLGDYIGQEFPKYHRQGARKGQKIVTTQLSAATKFLWFAGRHEVRIFDSQAYAALYKKKREGLLFEPVYQAFVEEWDRQYKAASEKLAEAISALRRRELLEWTSMPRDVYEKALGVMDAPWFKARVFDKYLWLDGAATLDAIEMDKEMAKA